MAGLIPCIAIGLVAALVVWLFVPVMVVRRFSLGKGKDEAEIEDTYRNTVWVKP